ncbi:MAG: glycosyltransferase [Lentisphaeria bacterium]|nr:glycosyltransferase [Candidatus Neomarinimicrobiota bacterium]MCF7841342.1 glycosyltransferase [Lentisphaeria bacterium]
MTDLKILINRDIVIISGQMLHDRYWTSKQYIAHELIKQNRVLYVEANYSFGKLFLGLLGKGWPVTLFGRLTQDESGIDVLTPPPRLPWRNHFHWIGQLNQLLLRWKIKRAMRKLNYQRPILWTFLHQTAALIGKLPAEKWIYHCVDDWPELLPMAKMGRPKTVRHDEGELIRKTDLVYSVSQTLLSHYKIPTEKVNLIANGVDVSLFDRDNLPEDSIPEDLRGLPKPIIGFSGSLGKWINTDLILQTAHAFPRASIVMIGLNEKNPGVDELLRQENIHFLGMKQRGEVPHYINAFDVCLMPFARSEVGEGLLPLKLFEYLAMGKPIVATSSPTLILFADILYLAENDTEFIQQVGEALKESNSELMLQRLARAREFSWAARLRKYDAALKDNYNQTEN